MGKSFMFYAIFLAATVCLVGVSSEALAAAKKGSQNNKNANQKAAQQKKAAGNQNKQSQGQQNKKAASQNKNTGGNQKAAQQNQQKNQAGGNQEAAQNKPAANNNNAQSQDSSPPTYGEVVPFKGFSDLQIEGVYRSVVESLFFEKNYDILDREPTARTESLKTSQWFKKEVPGGQAELLVGFSTSATSPNKLTIWERVTGKGGAAQAKKDVTEIKAVATAAAKATQQTNKKFSPKELEVEFYQLSYISSQNALQMLSSLGFSTGKPKPQLTLNQLPMVWETPDSKLASVVSPTQQRARNPAMQEPTTSGRMNRLMILYHPARGKETTRLKKVLEEKVDVPARQVLIESMVVELTERARRELGVEWEWQDRVGEVSGGFTTEQGGDTPLTLSFDNYQGKTANQLMADLRALVKEDRAQVLSTPSVLTTNNAQARIQVIQQVPVLNQVITEVRNLVEVNVSWEDVGIMLNIKPRISNKGKHVTMQIRTEVSEAPEYLTVPTPEGARDVAPVIHRRNVETVARVDNNTPFIIGGLIRKDVSSVTDGIPVLRHIPVLGNLFQVTKDVTERREDIIVLTPRVIEPFGPKRPAQPMDSERFDFMDNRLFRNSYRIKAADVFDLGFIKENKEITSTLDTAREFVTKYPEYGESPPFDEVKKERLPGEKAVVVRMIYEIVKKLGLYERVQLDNLIYFEEATGEPAGYDVEFLKAKLEATGVMDDGDFPREYPRNVLVLEYDIARSKKMQQIAGTPVAKATVKKVESEDEMAKLWLEGNALQNYSRDRTTVVLGTEDHMVRLKTAILVREILNVNPGILSLQNFHVGRKIVIPQVEEQSDKIFLVDHNVSLYHFESEFYYAAFKNKLQRYLEGIRETLKRHGM